MHSGLLNGCNRTFVKVFPFWQWAGHTKAAMDLAGLAGKVTCEIEAVLTV
jgi:hypothetical protein